MATNKAMLQNCLATLSRSNLNPLLARHMNLSDSSILKQFIDKNFQDTQSLNAATKIAERIYESSERLIKQQQYGLAFPMDAEVLAYSMLQATENIALEIAGGSCENALLMAFALFKRVYYNDITPQEVATFREFCMPIRAMPIQIINGKLM